MLDENIEKAEAACREVFENIAAIGPYESEVQRYSSSLQRLVISVTPINADGSLNLDQRIFLLFSGVKYMQLLTFWRSSQLQWIPFEQRVDFLKDMRLDIYKNWSLRVAYAEVEQLKMYIVFANVELSRSFPRIEGEYNFPERK